MITRADKESQVQEIQGFMEKSQAGFLVNFKGLKAGDMAGLRKELKTKAQAEVKVFRNTLVRRALANRPEEQKHLNPSLNGANAFIFAYAEPSQALKILSEHAETVEGLEIKSGLMEGRGLSLEEIKILAKLPSIEVLKAQLLSQLQGVSAKFLSTLAEAPRRFVGLVSAYKDLQKKGKQ